MKLEVNLLNRGQKTNGIKWHKVVHRIPDITGAWGKGLVPSGMVERHVYNVLNDAMCIQYCHGKAENTGHDRYNQYKY